MRLRKREVFGRIRYAPHPGQLLVHRSQALRRVLACGTRFGKSTAAAMEICAGLLEPRDSTLAWVIAPTYELTQRIWLRVAHTLQENLPHRVKAVIPREQRIVVVNLAGGISELRAKSADQPAGLLGEALDFVVIDEAASIRDDVWPSYVMPRLIDRRGWSLVVSTPNGPGWFYEEFRRGQRRRDPDYESWSMPTVTNPFVNPVTIEAERKRLSEDHFNQQFGAEFLGVPEEPCETCGGPSPDVRGWIELRVGEEPPRCPECDLAVDANGKCVVRDCGGTAWLNSRFRSGTEPDTGHLDMEYWSIPMRHPAQIRRDPST